jgi:murein DD-endopeptidase MepM/ murein hydrolase activator NlpD
MRFTSVFCKFVPFVLSFTLCGCTVIAPQTATPTIQPSLTAMLLPTDTPTLAPSATATPVPLITQIVSPLQGIPLSDLAGITSDPFNLKYPFSEGPTDAQNHPAVDLAFFHYKTLNSDVGYPIEAILTGKVVEALDNRFPYGNMVLIETPLDRLAPDLIKQMRIPQPYSDDEIKIRSTCQPDQTRISWSQSSQSVYVLYAHMLNPPTVTAGDEVQAGEVLGGIGASGHAAIGNEHLHLEIRVGPANAKFGVISEYLSSSTTEERYNYCIWALSEIFLPINPSLFWAPTSNQGQ